MNKPRIFISYKGKNHILRDRMSTLLRSFDACPLVDTDFMQGIPSEQYLDRIPEVLKQEADAVVILITKEMNDAPDQCRREADAASLLHLPVFCFRYGSEPIDRGLLYPLMNAEWIWLRDPEDRTKEAQAAEEIVTVLKQGNTRLGRNDTAAVLRDQADQLEERFRKIPPVPLPKPFFPEILPQVQMPGEDAVDLIKWFSVPGRNGCYILTGEGGAGKSTSLKALCHTDASFIPVYIPVRELNRREYDMDHPVLNYIGRTLLELDPRTLDLSHYVPELLKALCPHQAYLFLIDGINEATRFSEAVEDVHILHSIPGLNMVISARNRSGFENRAGYIHAEALPLTADQILELSIVHPVQIPAVLNERIYDLMRNPLILTMLINAYDRVDYEELNTENLADYTLADMISMCLRAQLSRQGYRMDHEVQADVRILIPLAMAYMHINGGLKDSIIDSFEFTDAVETVAKEILVPFGRRLPILLDNVTAEEEIILRRNISEYIREMRRNTLDFSEDQSDRSVSLLKHEMHFLEDAGRNGEVRWTHQTILDWFISRGIAILCQIASISHSEAAFAAYEWSEKWMDEISGPIRDSDRNSALYDDSVEIGEILYGLMKENYKSRAYRDLLLRIANAHGLHKTSNACRITLSALNLAEALPDPVPEQDGKERKDFEKLNSLTASAAYGLCHINGGIPSGMTEPEIVQRAQRTFDACLSNLQYYSDTDRTGQIFIRTEQERIKTLKGAALQKLAELTDDPEEKRLDLMEALQIAEEVLDDRRRLFAEITADKTVPLDKRLEIRKRVPFSLTAVGTIHFKMGHYEEAIRSHEEALRLRRECLNDPDAEPIRKDVTKGLNENRVRILGCRVRQGIPDEQGLAEFCREFQEVAQAARKDHFYKESQNIANNFRTLIVHLYRMDGLSQDIRTRLETTAGVISSCYNELNRLKIDLTHELPWHSLRTAPAQLEKEEQIRFLERSFRQYIDSKAFRRLLEIFSFPGELTGDLDHDLPVLNEFAEKWNYRKGKERQAIRSEDPVATAHREEIFQIASALGMTKQDLNSISSAQYVLVPGGANTANQTRCILAKDICDHLELEKVAVIALGSLRVIPPEEKQNIRDYAPDAETEFDALAGGMESVFGLKTVLTREEDENGGIFQEWRNPQEQRQWRHCILCTPSVNGRRANTIDTFEHFLRLFHVQDKAEIVLATTALHANYQLLALVPAALEHGIHLSAVGREVPPNTTLPAEHFLQEIKATINTMNTFLAWKNAQH